MVANFATSGHCVDVAGKPHGGHCATCLVNFKWRKSIGAPDVCPHGITLDTIPARPTIATKDPLDWPVFLVPMKLFRQPEDKGLGDIIARKVGPIGGDAYKEWYLKFFGKPCGCTERQLNLNVNYPL